MAKVKGTDLAKPGTVWICGACGKRSRSRYGFDADHKSVASPGWDESCMLNAVLCYERVDPGTQYTPVKRQPK